MIFKATFLAVMMGAFLDDSLAKSNLPFGEPCEGDSTLFCANNYIDVICRDINNPVNNTVVTDACCYTLRVIGDYCFLNSTVPTVKASKLCGPNKDVHEIDLKANQILDYCMTLVLD